jgi:hypothetical protein
MFLEIPDMELEPLPNRAEIIESVRLGDISPQMAELWNSNMGWEPFPDFRDKTKFDPMQESEWTLPMAAAWFIWRSLDAVRDQWPIYRRAWLMSADPANVRPELEVSLSKLFVYTDLKRLTLRGAQSESHLPQISKRRAPASEIPEESI